MTRWARGVTCTFAGPLLPATLAATTRTMTVYITIVSLTMSGPGAIVSASGPGSPVHGDNHCPCRSAFVNGRRDGHARGLISHEDDRLDKRIV